MEHRHRCLSPHDTPSPLVSLLLAPHSPHSPRKLACSLFSWPRLCGVPTRESKGGALPPAVVLHDVLHVPDLASNLLSVYHLTRDKGYTVKLQASRALFYHHGELRFEAQVNEHNVGYLLGHNITQSKNALSASTTCDEDLALWHQRCSHVNQS